MMKNDISYYSEGDQEFGGVVPMRDELFSMTLAGEASTLQRALHFLTRMWSVTPVSTIFWRTLDGREPQEDEPCACTCLMKWRDLHVLEETSPNMGRKADSDDGQKTPQAVKL